MGEIQTDMAFLRTATKLSGAVAAVTAAAGVLPMPVAFCEGRAENKMPYKRPMTVAPEMNLFGANGIQPCWSAVNAEANNQVTRASSPGVSQAHTKAHQTSVVRVVLTGGPCGGKSSALRKLTTVANEAGFDVYTVPECATILFSNGASAVDFGVDGYSSTYNANIVQMQLQMERTFTRIAASTGRPTILVMDRGIMDNKGYIDPAGWVETIDFVNKNDLKFFSEDYALSRYDAVIHLVSAADGAEKFYKWGQTVDDNGNVVIRSETPEIARTLDLKMKECWKEHPNHVVVPNDGSFQTKIDAVVVAVMAAALKKHPQPTRSVGYIS